MRRFLAQYRNHLARYLALATVIIVLGGGVGYAAYWYVGYKTHQAAVAVKTTTRETVQKGKDIVSRPWTWTKEKWRNRHEPKTD